MVAFSAGVDSTFLLKGARGFLGERAIAFTAASPTASPAELESAKELTRSFGCRHIILDSQEPLNPSCVQNPANRCFFCKDEIYRICRMQADRLGLTVVVDGTILDELKDHRPGLKSAAHWNVRHPLVEVEMTKDDIRRYSRFLGLPTWDKPSGPCLSSRFPYGTEITLERLQKIAACELFLQQLHLREFRVRDHGDLARVDLA